MSTVLRGGATPAASAPFDYSFFKRSCFELVTGFSPGSVEGKELGLDARAEFKELKRVEKEGLAGRSESAQGAVIKRLNSELRGKDEGGHAAQATRQSEERGKRFVDDPIGLFLDDAEVE
jgi:hypothetical protein